MPTARCGHVRRLLDRKLARVVSRDPFIIQLKYETPDILQDIDLGIDPGRENIGLAAATKEGKCVYLAEAETHNRAVKKAMTRRAESRHGRRHHDRQQRQREAERRGLEMKYGTPAKVFKSRRPCLLKETVYLKAHEAVPQKVIRGKEARFANRKREEDWLSPSGQQLLQMHLLAVKQARRFLPISGIVLERNIFDFQKLEDVTIQAWEYSKGPLYGYKSCADYISHKQNGRCPLCGRPIEHYHHVIPRSQGGADCPANIVGLCRTCHELVHTDPQTAKQVKDAFEGQKKRYQVSLLNSVMPRLICDLDELCQQEGLDFVLTDGRATKKARIAIGAEKGHAVDAYCILLSQNGIPSGKIIVPNRVHELERKKKKSANVIIRLHSRKYFLDGDLVATNRRRAFEQKEPSLEDYLLAFLEDRDSGKTQLYEQLQQLNVDPARREYTHRRNEKAVREAAMMQQTQGIRSVKRSTASMIDSRDRWFVFHPGDTVLYERTVKKTEVVNGKKKTTLKTKREVFVVSGIDVTNQRLLYRKDGKWVSRSSRSCRWLQGGALPCMGTRPLTEIE